jgi:hypothetical protein
VEFGLSVLPQTGAAPGGAGSVFEYPFKLSIVKPSEEEGGGTFLSIKEGRIQYTFSTNRRCYVSFYDDEKIDLSVLTEEGTYVVLLIVNTLFDGSGTDDNPWFEPQIVFCNQDLKINSVPSTRGIFSIPIGYVEAKEPEDSSEGTDLIYSVFSNNIVGDLVVNIEEWDDYFSITTKINNAVHGELYEGYTVSDLTFTVGEGLVYFNDETFRVPEQITDVEGDGFVYLTVDETNKVFEYVFETEEKPMLDEETQKKYYEVAIITELPDSGIDIFQSMLRWF